MKFRTVLATCVVITMFANSAHADLAAATLPTSRSVQVGDTATTFATIINAGSTPAGNCRIEPPNGIDADFSFQTTDPATNLPVGTPNAAVDVPAGQSCLRSRRTAPCRRSTWRWRSCVTTKRPRP